VRISRKRMPNGEFSPTFYVKAKVNGKLINRSTGCTDERTAKSAAKKLIGKLRQQSSARGLVENFRELLAGGEPIALDRAFNAFEAKPRKRPMGEKQLVAKKSYWGDFAKFVRDKHPGVKKLSQVGVPIAQAYISYIRASGRYDTAISYSRGRGKGKKSVTYRPEFQKLSNRTCNVMHGTLQQVFEALFHDAGLLENPFKAIPKLANEHEAREAFTPEELKLIGQKADPFLYGIFCVGINTGLRAGDICTLRWSEVDLTVGWISRRMGKTGNVVRIPILPGLRAYLDGLPRSGEYVLPEQARMYLKNPDGISYRVKKFLDLKDVNIANTRSTPGMRRTATIKDVHSLRHTFCYIAAIHNVPLPIVQSIVGHVDPKITQMYTDHVQDAVKQERLAAMPDYLGLPGGKVVVPPPAPVLTRDEKIVAVLRSVNAENWQGAIDEAIGLLQSRG
jgi:integrase